ncbi:MAG: 2-hydroxyglutaryl-CoA dehydratase [Epulopiscium sp.]|nr:2-hydroxyglutaryl-CoA dehydratase [Candidatus Epulonipiscium sp.]
MKVGIPKGLLYWKYGMFAKTFFEELGCEVIISGDTNNEILNLGINHSVDEACVPMKVFHGHVASLKDQCDLIFIPRLMRLSDKEYICPKFCGLPEMIKNSIPNMPKITEEAIYATSTEELYKSMSKIANKITKDKRKIKRAFQEALTTHQKTLSGINDEKYKLKIALLGHPYNVQDDFINMNIINKLHKLGVGVVTEEFAPQEKINKYTGELFKKPFWTFARHCYGASTYFTEHNKVDGIIYISAFACGIDSVVIELISNRIGDFPFLVLKIDEQTGRGGFDTRIEAFIDMIERRQGCENYLSTYG